MTPVVTTIRELMLAQQARHEGWTHPATERTTCSVCDEVWPCPDWVAADAVLATLDAAEIDIFNSRFDRVPDSEWVDAVRLAPETRHRSVPDPGVS